MLAKITNVGTMLFRIVVISSVKGTTAALSSQDCRVASLLTREKIKIHSDWQITQKILSSKAGRLPAGVELAMTRKTQ
jgi:hypothetical protein